MATSYVKLKVGITFLLALLILFIGILWLKEYSPSMKATRVRVVCNSTNGIAAGDPVTVSGIKVGEVVRISLTQENRALVELSIDRSVRLHPDAAFTVTDIGFMGDRELVVEPGKEPGTLDMSKVHTGSRSPGLDHLFSEAQDLVGGLVRIVERVDSDLDVAKLSESLEETLLKVRETAAAYRSLAQDAREPLSSTLERMGAASDGVSGFIRDNGNTAARAFESVGNTSERLSALIDSLSSVRAVIDTISARIKSGDGSFAKLIKSDSLYEELRHTSAAMDSFITDFRLNPGKYTRDMKFKVRLF